MSFRKSPRRSSRSHPPPSHAEFVPAGRVAVAGRVCGVMLVLAVLAAALAYVAGRAIHPDVTADAGISMLSDTPPRTPELTRGILWQVEQLKQRGMVAAIHDGSPTIVVVTDRYLESLPSLEHDLPLYGGHFVGFADDYTWQVHGHHNVILRHEDGTEIGRKTGPFSDAQVQQVYTENRRRLESTHVSVEMGAGLDVSVD